MWWSGVGFLFLSTPPTCSILVKLTLWFSGLTAPCARRASWRAWAMPRLLTVGTQHPASAADSSLASHACGVCEHTCLASLAFSSCDTICVQREYKCKGRKTKHSPTWMFGIRFFNWVSAHINNNVHIYLYIIQFHIIYISPYDFYILVLLKLTDRLKQKHDKHTSVWSSNKNSNNNEILCNHSFFLTGDVKVISEQWKCK